MDFLILIAAGLLGVAATLFAGIDGLALAVVVSGGAAIIAPVDFRSLVLDPAPSGNAYFYAYILFGIVAVALCAAGLTNGQRTDILSSLAHFPHFNTLVTRFTGCDPSSASSGCWGKFWGISSTAYALAFAGSILFSVLLLPLMIREMFLGAIQRSMADGRGPGLLVYILALGVGAGMAYFIYWLTQSDDAFDWAAMRGSRGLFWLFAIIVVAPGIILAPVAFFAIAPVIAVLRGIYARRMRRLLAGHAQAQRQQRQDLPWRTVR